MRCDRGDLCALLTRTCGGGSTARTIRLISVYLRMSDDLPADRPHVVHPKRIQWQGFNFEVISYQPFTDEQALKVVEHYIRQHARDLRKHRRHEIIQVRTAMSRDEVAKLEKPDSEI